MLWLDGCSCFSVKLVLSGLKAAMDGRTAERGRTTETNLLVSCQKMDSLMLFPFRSCRSSKAASPSLVLTPCSSSWKLPADLTVMLDLCVSRWDIIWNHQQLRVWLRKNSIWFWFWLKQWSSEWDDGLFFMCLIFSFYFRYINTFYVFNANFLLIVILAPLCVSRFLTRCFLTAEPNVSESFFFRFFHIRSVGCVWGHGV